MAPQAAAYPSGAVASSMRSMRATCSGRELRNAAVNQRSTTAGATARMPTRRTSSMRECHSDAGGKCAEVLQSTNPPPAQASATPPTWPSFRRETTRTNAPSRSARHRGPPRHLAPIYRWNTQRHRRLNGHDRARRSESLDGAAEDQASAGPTCRDRRRGNAAGAAPARPLRLALRSGYRPIPSIPAACAATLAGLGRIAACVASCVSACLAGEMLLICRGGCQLQAEIELDPGERTCDAQRLVALGVRHGLERHDQAVARGECEIVVDEGVAWDVDLCGQSLGARGGDQEMNVRRPISMTPQRRKEFGGRAVGRYRVTRRQKTAKPIRTVAVHSDPSSQFELLLRRIEMRVAAVLVAMPDIDDGSLQGGALGVENPALHDQHGSPRRRAVIQAHFGRRQRCVWNI